MVTGARGRSNASHHPLKIRIKLIYLFAYSLLGGISYLQYLHMKVCDGIKNKRTGSHESQEVGELLDARKLDCTYSRPMVTDKKPNHHRMLKLEFL